MTNEQKLVLQFATLVDRTAAEKILRAHREGDYIGIWIDINTLCTWALQPEGDAYWRVLDGFVNSLLRTWNSDGAGTALGLARTMSQQIERHREYCLDTWTLLPAPSVGGRREE